MGRNRQASEDEYLSNCGGGVSGSNYRGHEAQFAGLCKKRRVIEPLPSGSLIGGVEEANCPEREAGRQSVVRPAWYFRPAGYAVPFRLW